MTVSDKPTEHRPLEGVSEKELEMRYVLAKSMEKGMVGYFTHPSRFLSHDSKNWGKKEGQKNNWRHTGKHHQKWHETKQGAARVMMEKTAIKVFFGGVGEEQNIETAKKLINSGVGTIIDNAAPEITEHVNPEAGYARAMGGYKKALNICEGLLTEKAENRKHISAAFKFSTMSDQSDLEFISHWVERPENADKPWGQKELTPNAESALQAIYDRAKPFFERAGKMGIEAYVDAEETAINPAIMEICARMMNNGMHPSVTVQAYLKGADKLIDQLLAMESPPNIKLVRGAYLGGMEPRTVIWDTKQDTDDCYNRILKKLYDSHKIETITVATHNQESRKIAEDLVRESNGENNTRVVFATLMGIGASLTSPPKELGIEERKYQPAIMDKGDIAVLGAIAYFGRRAKEFMSATTPGSDETRGQLEMAEIEKEIKRRHLGYRLLGLAAMGAEIAAGTLAGGARGLLFGSR